MAFTYDISTSRGQVRFYSGDTNSATYLLEDNEIDFLLTENNSNIKLSAADAVEAMIAELSREPNSKKVGNLTLSFDKRMEQLQTTLKNLRRSANKKAVPFVGGISVSGKELYKANTDIVQPKFSTDMMKYDDPIPEEEC